MVLLMSLPATPGPATTAPAPCQCPEQRQFDFWVGDGELTGPAGTQVVGHSHIEAILGGCVIAEHWSSGSGGASDGKSFNIFNADSDHTWTVAFDGLYGHPASK